MRQRELKMTWDKFDVSDSCNDGFMNTTQEHEMQVTWHDGMKQEHVFEIDRLAIQCETHAGWDLLNFIIVNSVEEFTDMEIACSVIEKKWRLFVLDPMQWERVPNCLFRAVQVSWTQLMLDSLKEVPIEASEDSIALIAGHRSAILRRISQEKAIAALELLLDGNPNGGMALRKQGVFFPYRTNRKRKLT